MYLSSWSCSDLDTNVMAKLDLKNMHLKGRRPGGLAATELTSGFLGTCLKMECSSYYMHKLRKQSRSNRAIHIFTLISKMGLIKNEKKEFPFNDFRDFEEEKWSIFLFPPPLPSLRIDTLVIITINQASGGQEVLRSKMQSCSSHSEKVFPWQCAWPLNNVTNGNSHKNTKLRLALKIQSWMLPEAGGLCLLCYLTWQKGRVN